MITPAPAPDPASAKAAVKACLIPGSALAGDGGRDRPQGRKQGRNMTNQIALVLGLLILGLFAADALVLHWGLPVLLGKELASMIEYLSFWR